MLTDAFLACVADSPHLSRRVTAPLTGCLGWQALPGAPNPPYIRLCGCVGRIRRAGFGLATGTGARVRRNPPCLPAAAAGYGAPLTVCVGWQALPRA
jgi:hypothetical protein